MTGRELVLEGRARHDQSFFYMPDETTAVKTFFPSDAKWVRGEMMAAAHLSRSESCGDAYFMASMHAASAVGASFINAIGYWFYGIAHFVTAIFEGRFVEAFSELGRSIAASMQSLLFSVVGVSLVALGFFCPRAVFTFFEPEVEHVREAEEERRESFLVWQDEERLQRQELRVTSALEVVEALETELGGARRELDLARTEHRQLVRTTEERARELEAAREEVRTIERRIFEATHTRDEALARLDTLTSSAEQVRQLLSRAEQELAEARRADPLLATPVIPAADDSEATLKAAMLTRRLSEQERGGARKEEEWEIERQTLASRISALQEDVRAQQRTLVALEEERVAARDGAEEGAARLRELRDEQARVAARNEALEQEHGALEERLRRAQREIAGEREECLAARSNQGEAERLLTERLEQFLFVVGAERLAHTTEMSSLRRDLVAYAKELGLDSAQDESLAVIIAMIRGEIARERRVLEAEVAESGSRASDAEEREVRLKRDFARQEEALAQLEERVRGEEATRSLVEVETRAVHQRIKALTVSSRQEMEALHARAVRLEQQLQEMQRERAEATGDAERAERELAGAREVANQLHVFVRGEAEGALELCCRFVIGRVIYEARCHSDRPEEIRTLLDLMEQRFIPYCVARGEGDALEGLPFVEEGGELHPLQVLDIDRVTEERLAQERRRVAEDFQSMDEALRAAVVVRDVEAAEAGRRRRGTGLAALVGYGFEDPVSNVQKYRQAMIMYRVQMERVQGIDIAESRAFLKGGEHPPLFTHVDDLLQCLVEPVGRLSTSAFGTGVTWRVLTLGFGSDETEFVYTNAREQMHLFIGLLNAVTSSAEYRRISSTPTDRLTPDEQRLLQIVDAVVITRWAGITMTGYLADVTDAAVREGRAQLSLEELPSVRVLECPATELPETIEAYNAAVKAAPRGKPWLALEKQKLSAAEGCEDITGNHNVPYVRHRTTYQRDEGDATREFVELRHGCPTLGGSVIRALAALTTRMVGLDAWRLRTGEEVSPDFVAFLEAKRRQGKAVFTTSLQNPLTKVFEIEADRVEKLIELEAVQKNYHVLCVVMDGKLFKQQVGNKTVEGLMEGIVAAFRDEGDPCFRLPRAIQGDRGFVDDVLPQIVRNVRDSLYPGFDREREMTVEEWQSFIFDVYYFLREDLKFRLSEGSEYEVDTVCCHCKDDLDRAGGLKASEDRKRAHQLGRADDPALIRGTVVHFIGAPNLVKKKEVIGRRLHAATADIRHADEFMRGDAANVERFRELSKPMGQWVLTDFVFPDLNPHQSAHPGFATADHPAEFSDVLRLCRQQRTLAPDPIDPTQFETFSVFVGDEAAGRFVIGAREFETVGALIAAYVEGDPRVSESGVQDWIRGFVANIDGILERTNVHLEMRYAARNVDPKLLPREMPRVVLDVQAAGMLIVKVVQNYDVVATARDFQEREVLVGRKAPEEDLGRPYARVCAETAVCLDVNGAVRVRNALRSDRVLEVY